MNKYILSVLGLILFLSCNDNNKKIEDKNEQTTKKEITNLKQKEFIKKKSELFFNNILKSTNSALTTMFNEKTDKLTKDFLKDINNTLTDWTGKVICVIACDERGTVIGGNDKAKKILILGVEGGEVKFEDSEDNYSLYLEQAQSKKQKTKGIYPNNPLYNKIINLKEGQKIKFSAKVLNSREEGIYGPNGKEYRKADHQGTNFDVIYTAIEIIPTEELEK